MFGTKSPGHGGDDLLTADDQLGFSSGLTGDVRLDGGAKEGMNLARLGAGHGSSQSIQQYQTGQYCGTEVKRSPKLN
jgi:hypothetical protein